MIMLYFQTYNTDQAVPDSSGTATAFLSGEKTRQGTVGVNQRVPFEDCSMVEGNELTSMIHHAMDKGASGLLLFFENTGLKTAGFQRKFSYIEDSFRCYALEWVQCMGLNPNHEVFQEKMAMFHLSRPEIRDLTKFECNRLCHHYQY